MDAFPTLKRGQHLTEQQRAELGRELSQRYLAGQSIRDICRSSGYSIGRVRRLLIDAGVTFRARGGATRRPPNL
jgi:hypothetical protein